MSTITITLRTAKINWKLSEVNPHPTVHLKKHCSDEQIVDQSKF